MVVIGVIYFHLVEALCQIMNDLFDGVIYAGIDTDKHKYPIGKFLLNLFHFLMHFNPIQDGGQEGGGAKAAHPNSFSPVTSTNVGLSPQNVWTFNFNPCTTLV